MPCVLSPLLRLPVMPLLEAYLQSSTLRMVLVPSVSDVSALPVFPQPAYDASLFQFEGVRKGSAEERDLMEVCVHPWCDFLWGAGLQVYAGGGGWVGGWVGGCRG